jgi:UDP-N-acetylglucosamine/UDP-N-acetylgalactosamine diphosphorylase
MKKERGEWRMKATVEQKIISTKQKYLSSLIGTEVPGKLEKQLEEMDWSYIDLIHGEKQQRGTFAPLGAMEIP